MAWARPVSVAVVPATTSMSPPAKPNEVPETFMGESVASTSPRPAVVPVPVSSKGAPRWAVPELAAPLILTDPPTRSTTSSPAATGPSAWLSVPVVRLPWERTATSRPAVRPRVDTLAPLASASRPTS